MCLKSKLTCGVIVAIMLLVLPAGALPTQAQSGTILSVNPLQTSFPLGSQVQIDLLVIAGANVNAFDVLIEFDPEMLRLEGWGYGPYLTNLFIVKEVEGDGSFRLVCTQLATPAVSGEGVLLTLTFSGLNYGTSEIILNNAQFSDSEGNTSNPALENGWIEVINAPTQTSTVPIYTMTVTPTQIATQTSYPGATATPVSSPTMAVEPTQGSSNTPFPTGTETPLETATVPGMSDQTTPLGTLTPLPEEGTANPLQPQAGFYLPGNPGLEKTQQAWRDATLIYQVASLQGASGLPANSEQAAKESQQGEALLWILLIIGLIGIGILLILVIRHRKPPEKE